MANKALATRQKMRLRVEPSQNFGKPRNPIAALAKARSAGRTPSRCRANGKRPGAC